MSLFELFPPVWNGTLREHYLILFGAAGSIAVVAGLVGAWFGARFGMRRVVQQIVDSLPSTSQQEQTTYQLARLSQAMDAVSIEIERLSEGQRFAAKLLAERAGHPLSNPAPERPPGVITPH
jgi:hypothetical protein